MTDDEKLTELEGRLRELLRRATEGPWELQDGCSWRRIGTRFRDGNVLCPSTYSSRDNHPDLTAGKGEDLYANLTLIVEAINALPTLLTELHTLRQRNARLVEGLSATQLELEAIVRTKSTNFATVHDLIISNRRILRTLIEDNSNG